MPRELYISRNFGSAGLDVIDKANTIIEEYQAQGYALTLRQLYYQFVARGFISNDQKEYNKLGSIINHARLAGLIDWEAIEDRTRNLEKLAEWSSPTDVLKAVAEQYREDVWADQPMRVEVWVEKEALTGVIERICNQYQVPYFACRGYSSQSEQWRAGKRFLQRAEQFEQDTIILHFGDHDPSGIDMTRDNQDRLQMFSENHVTVKRLALNMDQVRQYNPPPNPAKLTDSRCEGYIAKFGSQSWELDALEPRVISNLIQKEIEAVLDKKKFKASLRRVDAEKSRLRDVAASWGA